MMLKKIRRADAPQLGKNRSVPQLGAHPVIAVRKTADQSVNNSTTLVNETSLQLAAGARQVWTLEYRLLTNTSAVADIKFQLSIPTGATARVTYKGTNAADVFVETEVASATNIVSGGTGANKLVVLNAHIVMGTVAGTLILQYAQNTGEVSNTKILQESLLIATRIV